MRMFKLTVSVQVCLQMIRLTFMTDRSRVIGSRDEARPKDQRSIFPDSLRNVAEHLYREVNIAVGSNSVSLLKSPVLTNSDKFILSSNSNFSVPVELYDATVVDSPKKLVERFGRSFSILNVIGGAGMLRSMLPYAEELVVIQSDWSLPGDVVFGEWDDDSFSVARMHRWQGGQTMRYRRSDKVQFLTEDNSTATTQSSRFRTG